MGNLIGIALSLQNALGSMAILTILIFPIQEHATLLLYSSSHRYPESPLPSARQAWDRFSHLLPRLTCEEILSLPQTLESQCFSSLNVRQDEPGSVTVSLHLDIWLCANLRMKLLRGTQSCEPTDPSLCKAVWVGSSVTSSQQYPGKGVHCVWDPRSLSQSIICRFWCWHFLYGLTLLDPWLRAQFCVSECLAFSRNPAMLACSLVWP